jgi:outer membrane immunogenic protein
MKSCSLIVLALLCTIIASAQFNIGLKGVINASSIKIEGNSYDARIGFAGGPYAEYYLSRELGITAELLYNEKGAKQVSTGTEIQTNLNYLSIPILFYFEPIQNLKLGLGPEVAFLLSAKAKGDSITTTDVKKYFQSFDKAVAFGGSYGVGRIGFSARYIAGFDGITNISYTDPGSGQEMTKKTGRNNVFQFAISLRLNKPKYKSVKENQ